MNKLPGKLILFSGSSGAGKDTLFKFLREEHPEFYYPYSWATRERRTADGGGKEYEYVTKEKFLGGVENGALLEWAEVHKDDLRGTPKGQIVEALKEGKTIVHELNVDGFRSLRDNLPEADTTSIFVTVPNWETLKNRILKREDMSEERLAQRHDSFLREKEISKEYDYVVENKEGNQEEFVKEVENIILNLKK